MTRHSSHLTALLAFAAGLIAPAAIAQAQYYGPPATQPPPLYPYVVQQGQSYAVQVAPNTYVIQRPEQTAAYPRVRHAERPAQRFDRPHKPVDHALVEELRKRNDKKKEARAEGNESVVRTTKIVRDPPVVVVHKRYVDDPPRVIERDFIADEPARSKCGRGILEHCGNASAPPQPSAPNAPSAANAPSPVVREGGERGGKRVIHAEAEVTILGPDRMSIRLYRKGRDPEAKAQDGD
jgi:hypothetical protein